MKKIRKRKSLIGSFIVLFAILLLCFFVFYKGSYIVVKNNTDFVLSDLSIKYIYADKVKVIKLPDIYAKKAYRMKLTLPEDFIEGTIRIGYHSKDGSDREETLVGYIEKGYHRRVAVEVNSVDQDGNLSIKVK